MSEKSEIPEARLLIVKSAFFETPYIYTKWMEEQEKFLREHLKGKTVKAGETTEIAVLGHKIPIEIVSTEPQNTRVKVTNKTKMALKTEEGIRKDERAERTLQSIPFPVKIGKAHRITIPIEWAELLDLKEGEIIWLIISKKPP